MTLKKDTLIKFAILTMAASSSFFLLGCSFAEDTIQKNDERPKPSELTASDLQESQQEVSNNKLTVDHHRCIGCGKCARVSPQNFKMENGKAIVVSQEEESNSQQAIDICPVNAIAS